MSTLKLAYWKMRGIAEPIRILLHYLDIDYIDQMYELGDAPDFSREKWLSEKFKLGLEYPNLPYLFDGDFKLTESNAILRYICGKFKPELLGESLKEKASVDMVAGVLADLARARSLLQYFGKDCNGNEELKDTMNSKLIYLNNALEKNKFIAGEKLTYVDFVLAENSLSINTLLEPIYEKYPNFKRHFDTIYEIPNIKKYRDSKKPLPFNNKFSKYNSEA